MPLLDCFYAFFKKIEFKYYYPLSIVEIKGSNKTKWLLRIYYVIKRIENLNN